MGVVRWACLVRSGSPQLARIQIHPMAYLCHAGPMDPWPAFVAAVAERHGVGDVALAGEHGISASTFYRRTAREGWPRPAPRVRLHPTSRPSVQRDLVVAAASCPHPVAASQETAAWLHGLEARPPSHPTVLVPHGAKVAFEEAIARRLRVVQSRWFEPSDVVAIAGVPTLSVPALLLSCAALPLDRLRARLIDVFHRQLASPVEVEARLERAGPIRGRATLRRCCEQLAGLQVESHFQWEVAEELQRLGYRPERGTRHLDTADGIGLTIDVPLPLWQVAVEPDGDAFHRTREQRRIDRRREAAFASTEWSRVPVDWRDWHLEREHVLRAIDAAIAAQRRRGIGRGQIPPRRNAGRRSA